MSQVDANIPLQGVQPQLPDFQQVEQNKIAMQLDRQKLEAGQMDLQQKREERAAFKNLTDVSDPAQRDQVLTGLARTGNVNAMSNALNAFTHSDSFKAQQVQAAYTQGIQRLDMISRVADSVDAAAETLPHATEAEKAVARKKAWDEGMSFLSDNFKMPIPPEYKDYSPEKVAQLRQMSTSTKDKLTAKMKIEGRTRFMYDKNGQLYSVNPYSQAPQKVDGGPEGVNKVEAMLFQQWRMDKQADSNTPEWQEYRQQYLTAMPEQAPAQPAGGAPGASPTPLPVGSKPGQPPAPPGPPTPAVSPGANLPPAGAAGPNATPFAAPVAKPGGMQVKPSVQAQREDVRAKILQEEYATEQAAYEKAQREGDAGGVHDHALNMQHLDREMAAMKPPMPARTTAPPMPPPPGGAKTFAQDSAQRAQANALPFGQPPAAPKPAAPVTSAPTVTPAPAGAPPDRKANPPKGWKIYGDPATGALWRINADFNLQQKWDEARGDFVATKDKAPSGLLPQGHDQLKNATQQRVLQQRTAHAIVEGTDELMALSKSPVLYSGAMHQFGGRTPEMGLFEGPYKEALARKLTSESSQILDSIQQGIGRELSFATNLGLRITEAEVKSFEQNRIKPGETVASAQYKIVSAAATLRNALATGIDRSLLTPESAAAIDKAKAFLDTIPTRQEYMDARNESRKGGKPMFFDRLQKMKPKDAAAPGAPEVGAVQKGYRYKGGPPGSPQSWEKVQ